MIKQEPSITSITYVLYFFLKKKKRMRRTPQKLITLFLLLEEGVIVLNYTVALPNPIVYFIRPGRYQKSDCQVEVGTLGL